MRKQGTVLVVDDAPDNILVAKAALDQDFNVLAATNGPEALDIVRSGEPPDIVLLDILMPGMNGYQVCRELKQDEATRHIPVLFVTTMGQDEDETAGLRLGAADYITKPVRPAIVLARVRNHLALKRHQDHLEDMVAARTAALSKTQDVTILSLASLAELRDNELGGHFLRTQNVAALLARDLARLPRHRKEISQDFVQLLYKSAPLHDVGKVGVPDSILLKPGRLTPEEFEAMKRHTVYGRDAMAHAEKYLQEESFLGMARDIAYTHHEKWDGSGYPRGLAGEDIPTVGRIMAVADVYDALISKRVYKEPMTHTEAASIVAQGRGIHFDPDLADIFLQRQEDIRAISIQYADSDEERQALAL